TDGPGTVSARDVTTSGNIVFNDPATLNGTYDSSAGNGVFNAASAVTLGGNVTVNSGNGKARFLGAVDADAALNNRTLAVNSGGLTTFGSAVGANQRLASLTTDFPGTTSARGVSTIGNITFNDAVTLNGTYDTSFGNGAFLA